MTPSLKTILLGAPITPARLFRSGEQGFWYDPSDLSTMFQDSAGTTPVTATGQLVGRILDKSGRGNHAIQATGAARPTLQRDSGGRYYLDLDGVSASMYSAASIDFTGTDKMTVWAGVSKLSDAAAAVMLEFTSSSVNNGMFAFYMPLNAATANVAFASRGTVGPSTPTAAGIAAPDTSVFTGLSDISNDTCILRRNGVQIQSSASDQGAGTYSNAVLNIGRRDNSSLPFTGRLYQLIGRGAATNDTYIRGIERWVNSKTAAY